MSIFSKKKSFFNTKKILLPLLFFFSIAISYSQEIVVSGSVKESKTNSPIPGVNIIIKGKTIGITSDFDGLYSIKASLNDILVFSYLGYAPKEIKVTSATINVFLEEDTQSLDEIVIIGYGTTTVKDATGAVTAITEKNFNKGNITTAENLLNGKVAGLTINTGGEPGAGSTIRIRGGASLGASNDPLIVINGLPVDNNAIGGSRSILSSINPNEIASFSILKDASATAIYGSRASNGVIIITTKKGSRNLNVNLDMNFGINTLPNKVDVFSGDELRNLVSSVNPSLTPLLGNANTDWQDEIYNNSATSIINASANGMLLNKIPTRISIGRTYQEGLQLTSRFERNNASFNLNPNFLNNSLKISVNGNASFEKNRFASGQAANALTFDPTQPVYDENSPFGGYFQYYTDNNDGVINEDDLTALAPFNPLAELLQRRSISNIQRFYGNVKIDYNFNFLPELSAVLNVGMDKQNADGTVRVSDKNPLAQNDGSLVGSYSEYTNSQNNTLLDGYLSYNKEWNNFNVDGTAGYSYQKFTNKRYVSGELLDDGPDSEPVNNVDPNLVLIGFFGRANFSFYDKYLVTLSYRRDGTSRFSKENRWGNFPSAAIAWKIKEDLFPESENLSSLKLRLGWGITGQQDIGRNNLDLFLSRYIRGLPSSQYIFGDTTTPVGIPQFRNEELKWEETTTYNIGFDYGLFNDKITGSLEGFYKESKDLLSNAAISDGSNFSNSGFQNIGNFTSQGIEFSIGGDLITNDDGLNIDFNFNTTFIKTEIKKLALDQDQLVGGADGGTGNTAQIHREGFTPFSFFVYKQVYDSNNNPIEGAYADLNGDNLITDADKYIHHNGAPSVTFGYASNFYYKNFDLSFNLRANIDNYVYNNVNSSRAQYDLLENSSVVANLPTSVLQSNFNTTENVILSDYYIENASFLRMDNITTGYTFNEIFSNKSSIRLSASVQNVFVITNYSGLDPEVFSNGIDNTITPRPRTFTIGANIKF
ncbi:SusC/RagA family TonB-linked outer membrane protein [Polaribacter atrinae]|uniref:SusC/RagA family TonB-linked outer membrane protein n=1 Tax=Polaribacter atrinae TaxID=1333662 RepID=UPI002490E5E2|nr:SusC/RagA family TonB-linked outer membrane protein [Polaribacter atrinae]